MKPEAADDLIRVYVTKIAEKHAIDAPPPERQQRYLEDLMAAEFRRQDRNLA
jgi:hypothetical protein